MRVPEAVRAPLGWLAACAIVGLLAVMGLLTSVTAFPLVFGGIAVVSGLLSLRGHRGTRTGLRLTLVVLAGSVAFGGWFAQQWRLDRARERLQQELSASLVGAPAPPLRGLETLNTTPAALELAASYAAPATIVTFWARWCSPCWTELPELDALYREHAASGLAVVAVASYDQPDDELARGKQLERDRRFVLDRGLRFPAALTDEGAIQRGFQVRSLPSTALVDGRGRIAAYGVGLEGGREVMRRAVALLQTAASGPDGQRDGTRH